MPESENQLEYGLVEFLQLDSSTELHAEQVTILTNHY
jgi:hypothetical protein